MGWRRRGGKRAEPCTEELCRQRSKSWALSTGFVGSRVSFACYQGTCQSQNERESGPRGPLYTRAAFCCQRLDVQRRKGASKAKSISGGSCGAAIRRKLTFPLSEGAGQMLD